MGCLPSKTAGVVKYAVREDVGLEHDPFLLRIVSASSIPSLDHLSESDVYAVARLLEDGVVINSVVWPVKVDAVNPYWNSIRSLGPASANARIHLEFWDHDGDSFKRLTGVNHDPPDFIGSIELGVGDLPASGAPLTIPILTKHKRKGGTGPARCVISRAPPEAYTAPKKKTIFLIRHGESVWNEAQADKNVVGMFSEVDHPLNGDGRIQSEGLAAHLAREAREAVCKRQ